MVDSAIPRITVAVVRAIAGSQTTSFAHPSDKFAHPNVHYI